MTEKVPIEYFENLEHFKKYAWDYKNKYNFKISKVYHLLSNELGFKNYNSLLNYFKDNSYVN